MRWAEDVLSIADTTLEPHDRRIRVDTRKWLLSKVLPKVFGGRKFRPARVLMECRMDTGGVGRAMRRTEWRPGRVGVPANVVVRTVRRATPHRALCSRNVQRASKPRTTCDSLGASRDSCLNRDDERRKQGAKLIT